MIEFRGEIYNGEGKCIFSRLGKAKDEDEALMMLHMKVSVDVRDEYDFVNDMSFIPGLSLHGPSKRLKQFYNDISELKFFVKKV